MQEHIINHLKTKTAVTDIIGSDPIKAFPGDAPDYMQDSDGIEQQVKRPYLLIESAGGQSAEDMDGRTGCSQTFYQITAVGKSNTQAHNLYFAVRNALGQAIYEEWDDVLVMDSNMDFPTDVSQPPTDASADSFHELAGRLEVTADYES